MAEAQTKDLKHQVSPLLPLLGNSRHGDHREEERHSTVQDKLSALEAP